MFRPVAHKGRSIWKGNGIYLNIKNLIFRSVVISKFDIGKVVFTVNGYNLIKFIIERKHVGHKIGQFFFTKKMGFNIHLLKIKKKKKNKKY